MKERIKQRFSKAPLTGLENPPGDVAREPGAAETNSKGALITIIGSAGALVLMIVIGVVWLANSGPEPKSTTPRDTGPAPTIALADSPRAEKLFPENLELIKHPEYSRASVGEAECAAVTATKRARQAVAEHGCENAYVASYVSDEEEYTVTIGYIDVGSKAKAKKAGEAKQYGSFGDTAFKFLIPDGSEIEEDTRPYTFVTSDRQYVAFSVALYHDGSNAQGYDKKLMEEAIAVQVKISFGGK
ncbi:MAG: hypothetical protein ACRDT8_10860 [Micromonosporaceae bacterium]